MYVNIKLKKKPFGLQGFHKKNTALQRLEGLYSFLAMQGLRHLFGPRAELN